jgi:ribonuclease P/MRP protein subunit RPP40
MEELIYRKLLCHLESNGILPNCQHGFREKHSVTTQLLSVIDDLSLAIENKQCVDIIYFDMQKAFDTVPHSRLLDKLSNFGIDGPLHKWLSDYLLDRKFHVQVNSTLSEEKNIKNGVPQGSILGPLLFIAYISDLPDFCQTENVKLKLFADDLKAYHISKPNPEFHIPLQNFIDKLAEYCSINGLRIAVQKCSTLHLGNKNPSHNYSHNNTLIPNIPKGESVRDLGIHFTADLKWNAHINIITKKSRRISYALLKSLKSNDPKFLVQMFKSYILPILEFSSPVFNPYYAKDINALEKIQRDFVKLVNSTTNLNKTEN